MIDTAIYFLGYAVAVLLALAAVAGLAWLVGNLLQEIGDYMLRMGLRTVQIANWRYWCDRMTSEGLMVMSRFYADEVKKRSRRTPRDFERAEHEARQRELTEEATARAAARWWFIHERSDVTIKEGRFTSLGGIVSPKWGEQLDASADRMIAGDFSDADAARAQKDEGPA